MGAFEELYQVNVNGYTEKKVTGGVELTYLSWPFAWASVKAKYPDASYSVWKDENGLPYTYDKNTGYMVYTSVTIDGVTHEMWLPVMDGANKAMKSEAYTVKTKYKEITVQPATMFDVNKTIMRCLVKNLAMFGLGLYIYAGEDLPEGEEKKSNTMTISGEQKAMLLAEINRTGIMPDKICERYQIASIDDMPVDVYTRCMSALNKSKTA